jgi:shikimate kinase
MASGKSAVGKILASKLNIRFIDLDVYIETSENTSIKSIFETKGEIYFRIKESEYLQEILNLTEDCIISLGGGTPCYGANMDYIKKNSKSFYLKASINTIFNRIKGETSQRPLVATIGVDNLKEFIGKHLFERTLFYTKADETILVNDKSLETIVEEISELL